jgi:hypothetical protein
MTSEYYTSQFIENSPYYLRRIYNQMFTKSLLSLINTAARGFKKEYVQLTTMVNILNPDEKFNPQLHAIHASLVNALKNNSVIEVSRLLVTLFQVLEHHPYAQVFGVSTITSESWEQDVLESLKEQNRNQYGKLPTIDLVDEDQIMKYSSLIAESLESLKKASPLFFKEFESYVTEIKLFNSDRLVGMTDPRLFGSVYICIPNNELPPSVYFCEHIIHETSHLHLNTLFAQDRLILNDPSERYTAPIRPDPRPMYGIFHATYVLSRMVRIFDQLARLFEGSSYKTCLTIFKKQFINGYTTINCYGKLTERGQKILQSYSDIIAI